MAKKKTKMNDSPKYNEPIQYPNTITNNDEHIVNQTSEISNSKSIVMKLDFLPTVFCLVVVIYWAILWYKYSVINEGINKLDIQQFRSTLNEMKIFGIVMPLLYILTLGLCYSSVGKYNVVFSQVILWLTILMIGFGVGIWWISTKILNECLEGTCDYFSAKRITNYLFTILGCGFIANFMAIIYFYFFNEMMKQQMNMYFASIGNYFSSFQRK